LIYLANAGTLSYPDPLGFTSNIGIAQRGPQIPSNGQTSISSTPLNQMPFQHWTVDPNKFEYNMNFISIVIAQDGAPNLLGEGDEVGVFVNNEVRGSGKALYIPALNTYMIFATAYANKNGEELTFKFYDASENKELSVIDKSTFKVNAIMGNIDAPLPLRLTGTSKVEELGLSSKARLYPNPFIHQLNIDFDMDKSGEVIVSILDVLGNVVFDRLIESTTGHNTLEWKPKADIPRGTYFVKIQGGDISHYQKVLYLK
jgi:Secretion system C-terminal sorting domain